jgi:Zn-dependent protease with chaperone function
MKMVWGLLAAVFGLVYLVVALFMLLFIGLMMQGAVILTLKYLGIEL